MIFKTVDWFGHILL